MKQFSIQLRLPNTHPQWIVGSQKTECCPVPLSDCANGLGFPSCQQLTGSGNMQRGQDRSTINLPLIMEKPQTILECGVKKIFVDGKIEDGQRRKDAM